MNRKTQEHFHKPVINQYTITFASLWFQDFTQEKNNGNQKYHSRVEREKHSSGHNEKSAIFVFGEV